MTVKNLDFATSKLRLQTEVNTITQSIKDLRKKLVDTKHELKLLNKTRMGSRQLSGLKKARETLKQMKAAKKNAV